MHPDRTLQEMYEATTAANTTRRVARTRIPSRHHVVVVPLGQQKCYVSRGTSSHLAQPRGPPRRLFRSGQGGHLATLRVVPSRVTRSSEWQIDLSALCHVRPRGNAQDPAGSPPGLPSHRRTTHLARDVVHARASNIRGEGVHPFDHSQSAAFSRIATSDGTLRRVREHVAEDQAGIRWLSRLGPDPCAEMGVHPSLPRKGEHRPRRGIDHQKRRQESHGQTHAQLLLGQIRREPVQTHHPTTPAHLFHLVSNPTYHIHTVRICNPETLEVVHSDPQDNKADNGKINLFVAAFTTCHARLKLYEYLDLLKEQVLYFDTDSVFLPPSRPTRHPDGGFLGGDHGRVGKRRLHRGFFLRRP